MYVDGKILAEPGFGKNITTLARPAVGSKMPKIADKKTVPRSDSYQKSKAYFDLEPKSSNSYQPYYLTQQKNNSSSSLDFDNTLPLKSPSRNSLVPSTLSLEPVQTSARTKQPSLTNVAGRLNDIPLAHSPMHVAITIFFIAQKSPSSPRDRSSANKEAASSH